MLLTEGISPHLTSDVIDRCKQAGIKTVLDFLSCDTETLATKISTAYKDVSSIQRVLLACYASFPQSADSLYDEQLQSLSILNTGISRLDEFLDGGVYTSEITEIYGLPGTGKTQFSLCILSSLILESENSALYLDSNGSFIGKRIEQMLLHKSNNFQMVGDAMNRLRVTNVYDIYNLFDALHYVKSQLCKQDQPFFSSLKLIVVDSLTPLIGPCLVGNQFDGLGLLMNASQLLKSLCYEHSLSVVICNNTVYGEDSVVTPALGRYWKHVPSVTLCINKRNDSLLSNTDRLRKLSVVKSCRSGTFGEVLLNITNDGISVIDV